MGIWYQCLSDECEAVFEAGDEIIILELPNGEERFVMSCPECGGEVSMEDPQPYDSPVPSRVDAPPDSQWVVVSKQGKAHLLFNAHAARLACNLRWQQWQPARQPQAAPAARNQCGLCREVAWRERVNMI
jgi:hypothetical protein